MNNISNKIIGICLTSIMSGVVLADTATNSPNATNNAALNSPCCEADYASSVAIPTTEYPYGITPNTANGVENSSTPVTLESNTAESSPAYSVTPNNNLDNYSTYSENPNNPNNNPSCNQFGISLYQPTYLLPFYHTMSPLNAAASTPLDQKLNQNEVRFQISFKVPLWVNLFNQNNAVYAAYTQDSFWQLYNNSPFFTETNYEPEIFLDNRLFKNLGDGWNFSDLDLGIVHQSNGRGGEFERSWNRAYLDAIFNQGNWMISIKPWKTIFDAVSSDLHNPDITHFLGDGEEMLAYQYDRNTFSFTMRNVFESDFKRGAEWATWSYPLLHRNIKGYIFLFSGYGENLIEYNHYTNAAGIGVTLNDVDDLSSFATNPFDADSSADMTGAASSAAVVNNSEPEEELPDENSNAINTVSNNHTINSIINNYPDSTAAIKTTNSVSSSFNTPQLNNINYSNSSPCAGNTPNNGELCNQFGITLYQPTYILPFYHSSSPFNDGQQIPVLPVPGQATSNNQKLDQNQVKYQISFKVPIWENLFNHSNTLYAAYTQDSFWQLYNESPFFSETDYEPEIFLDNQLYKNLGSGWQFSDFDIGVVHQSNGRGGYFERSWNRAYLDGVFHNGNWMVSIKPWATIFDAESLDEHNPDITHYLGYGQEMVSYQCGRNTLSLALENEFESGFRRGDETATWSFPLLHHNVKGYVYLFSGYGESLIAYNHYTNGAGIGITLNDWN